MENKLAKEFEGYFDSLEWEDFLRRLEMKRNGR